MIRRFFSMILSGFMLLLLNNVSTDVQAQTAGTLTFSYTQSPASASATKNVMAVWIEDNAGNFVKTRMRFWGNNTTDHLPSWDAKSGQNLVDATSGATRTASTSPTAFGTKTISWDGTNVSGSLVADGIYKVFVESSYCNPEPANGQHWIISSFSFTKGIAADHQTPAGPANFSNITVDWVPNTTSVDEFKENNNLSVYPNPTKGNLTINYKDVKRITVENILGSLIYDENIANTGMGSKTIDMKKYTDGVYIVKVELRNSDRLIEQKVLLNK